MRLRLFAFLIVDIVHIVTIREGGFFFFLGEQIGEGGCYKEKQTKERRLRNERDDESAGGAGGDVFPGTCEFCGGGCDELVHGVDVADDCVEP